MSQPKEHKLMENACLQRCAFSIQCLPLIGRFNKVIIRQEIKVNSLNMQLWSKIKEKLKTRSTKIKKPLVEYKNVTDNNL